MQTQDRETPVTTSPHYHEPVVLVMSTSVACINHAPNQSIPRLLARLKQISETSNGLFVFPSTNLPKAPPDMVRLLTRYTLNQIAGARCHEAARILYDGLANALPERILMSDFRPVTDDVARPFEPQLLAAMALPRFCGLLVPAIGEGMYAPGVQIAELCVTLGVPLTIAANERKTSELDLSNIADLLALANDLGLPSDTIGAAHEHGVPIEAIDLVTN